MWVREAGQTEAGSTARITTMTASGLLLYLSGLQLLHRTVSSVCLAMERLVKILSSPDG